MSSPIARLGAFDLLEAIGEGGMGTVFRGVHVHEGVEVAVKVVSGASQRETRALSAFRREVRAVAALTHGNIVSVLDHDLIPAGVVSSDPRIVAGSPYLVMELAEATLRERPPAPHWTAVRSVLMQLLDALSHAHAHGIVHRDLKPPNILWVRSGEARLPRVKLSDFGLAHALATDTEYGRGAGTPSYMAPEQFRAHARDFGPWTDLYAVGCIAYWLVSGRRVFEDRDEVALAQRHLHEPPPPLTPRFSVPNGLERWIRRLLEKNPLRRYRFAADAAYGLERLSVASMPPTTDATDSYVTTRAELIGEQSAPFLAGNVEREIERIASELGDDGETTPTVDGHKVRARMERADDTSSNVKASVSVRPSARPPGEPVEEFAPDDHRPPPLPLTWRRTTETLPRQLLGAGLGLFGLRAIPLVGRTEERDRMWRALAGTLEHQRPTAIVISGAAGLGKTSLAEWFERRAHEVGAAHTMTAAHERGARGRRTLVEMVRAHLGVRGLDWAGTSQRVRQYMATHGVMDDHERRALADLVAPSGVSERAGQRLVPMVTEHALIARVLERASRDRPLLVRLDDVQWSIETLAFVERMLDESRLPIVFVLTVQEEALSLESTAVSRLRTLTRRLDVVHLPLSQLSESDHETLVRSLLFLGPELAGDVARRTAGNPLFAREVVRDWVQRGLLRLTDEGFVLAESASVEVPDDLHAHFRSLVLRSVGEDAGELAALELAAISGERIDPAEWRVAVDLASITVARGFFERMQRERLLVPGDSRALDGSLRFSHGLLRESLERSAREEGRARALHRAIADMLEPRFATGELEVAERLFHHQLGAGRVGEALEPMRAAWTLFTARAEYERALEVLALHAATCAGLDPTEARDERVRNLLGEAEVRAAMGELETAESLSEDALRAAREAARDEPLARAMSVAGYVAALRSKPSRAEALLAEALQRFDRLGLASDAARCLRGLASIAAREGRTLVAFQAHLAALEHCRAASDDVGVAASLVGMGLTDPNEAGGAEAPVLEALEIGERIGHFFTVVVALNALGEIARRHGRHGEAESRFRRAEELAESMGASHQRSIARVSVALVLVEAGRLREAREHLTATIASVEALGHMALALEAHALALVTHAKLGSVRSLRHHIWAARQLLEGSVRADEETHRAIVDAAAVEGLDALDARDLVLLAEEARPKPAGSIPHARAFFVRG